MLTLLVGIISENRQSRHNCDTILKEGKQKCYFTQPQ